jgi:hypothetical protein
MICLPHQLPSPLTCGFVFDTFSESNEMTENTTVFPVPTRLMNKGIERRDRWIDGWMER